MLSQVYGIIGGAAEFTKARKARVLRAIRQLSKGRRKREGCMEIAMFSPEVQHRAFSLKATGSHPGGTPSSTETNRPTSILSMAAHADQACTAAQGRPRDPREPKCTADCTASKVRHSALNREPLNNSRGDTLQLYSAIIEIYWRNRRGCQTESRSTRICCPRWVPSRA